MLDVQWLRNRYYYKWVENPLGFIDRSGNRYAGVLVDWLADGTFVFENLTAQTPSGGTVEIEDRISFVFPDVVAVIIGQSVSNSWEKSDKYSYELAKKAGQRKASETRESE
jgi:hypothetical protein